MLREFHTDRFKIGNFFSLPRALRRSVPGAVEPFTINEPQEDLALAICFKWVEVGSASVSVCGDIIEDGAIFYKRGISTSQKDKLGRVARKADQRHTVSRLRGLSRVLVLEPDYGDTLQQFQELLETV